MDALNISDLRFGPRHWWINNILFDNLLIGKINFLKPDPVIVMEDSTSDGLETEIKQIDN